MSEQEAGAAAEQVEAGAGQGAAEPVAEAGAEQASHGNEVGYAVSFNPWTSAKRASVGRVVHIYCPELLGDSPQPAIVVGGPFREPLCCDGVMVEQAGQFVNINMFVDGGNFPKALEAFRGRSDGNTFRSVPLFDPVDPELRELLGQKLAFLGTDSKGKQYRAWCEWPPMV